jgi:hypothetical protein
MDRPVRSLLDTWLYINWTHQGCIAYWHVQHTLLCGDETEDWRQVPGKARRIAEVLGLTLHEQSPDYLFAAVLLQVPLDQTRGLQCST